MTLIQAGAIGMNFRVLTGIELPNLESAVIKVLYPDGTTGTWTPDTIDTTNGYLNYETVDGDLDQSGDYVLQAYLVFDDGEIRWGEAVRFHVYKNLVDIS